MYQATRSRPVLFLFVFSLRVPRAGSALEMVSVMVLTLHRPLKVTRPERTNSIPMNADKRRQLLRSVALLSLNASDGAGMGWYVKSLIVFKMLFMFY